MLCIRQLRVRLRPPAGYWQGHAKPPARAHRKASVHTTRKSTWPGCMWHLGFTPRVRVARVFCICICLCVLGILTQRRVRSHFQLLWSGIGQAPSQATTYAPGRSWHLRGPLGKVLAPLPGPGSHLTALNATCTCTCTFLTAKFAICQSFFTSRATYEFRLTHGARRRTPCSRCMSDIADWPG